MPLELPENRIPAITKIVKMSDAVIAELTDALSGATFPTRQSEMVDYLKQSTENIKAEDLSEIIEALYELYYIREFSGNSHTRFLNDLMGGVRHALDDLVDAKQLASAKNRLKALLEIESLGNLSKGVGLQRDHERLYCEGKILSDIRPVFSGDATSRPIGAALCHTLRISYHEGREHKDFFVVLDKSDLDALRNLVERAHNKSKALTNFIKEVNLPDLGM